MAAPEQLRAEEMTRREEPVGRLVVGEPILGRHRILEQPDRLRAPPLRGGDARRHDRPRDVEDGVERVESGGGIGGSRGRKALELSRCSPRLLDPTASRESHAAPEEIPRREPRRARIGRQQRDHLVPQPESHQRRVLLCQVPARIAHGEQHVDGNGLRHALHRRERLGLASLHGRREGEERVVVSEVHRVVIGRVGGGEVGAIGGDAPPVGLRRILVAADALEDVSGHVLEVARGGHEAPQPLGGRDRLARLRGGLHDVDVVVIGAGVARVALQHRLEPRLDLERPRRRPAVRGPELPGVHGHLGLRAQRLHVEIGRKARRDLAHGGGVGAEDGRGVRGGRGPR